MLEICVEDVAGVAAAVAGGADRLEVCSGLALGGLTPSPALVAHAAASGLPVRALIRPRPGGFHYGPAELQVIAADIDSLLDAGAEGLVLGVANAAGELDEAALIPLLQRARSRGARPVGLTLHRMIDLVADPVATLLQAAALGFDSVLSSGGAPCALDGAATLARMEAARPRPLTLMAGAGVTAANAAELLARSGVRALHASARGRPVAEPAPLVALGLAPEETGSTAQDVVRAIKLALQGQHP